MIEEQACVIGVEGEEALLQLIRSQPCGLCGQTQGCGFSLIGRLLGHQPPVLRARNAIHADTGDLVVVGFDEHLLLRGSLLVYMMPIVCLILGAMIGSRFTLFPVQDFNALAGAATAVFLYSLGRSLYSRKQTRLQRPVLLRLQNPDFT